MDIHKIENPPKQIFCRQVRYKQNVLDIISQEN